MESEKKIKTILRDKGPKRAKSNDVIEPAVKYVRAQRAKNNEDQRDAELKSKSDALTSDPSNVNFSDFYNMSTLTKQIASEKWAEAMAKRIITWAETDEALALGEFYAQIGILNSDFTDLASKYPILGKALDYSRMLLGVRREKGMITRKFDAGSVAFMMPHYDSAWREIVAWRASLKQPVDLSGQPRLQYVVIPEIPNSDLVKIKHTSVEKIEKSNEPKDSDTDLSDPSESDTDEPGKIDKAL